ncbi:MAG: hypothetical protein F6K09_01410 [Merismopedia sp. SIO2A8]|nr:hypothetical protein [Merismopedia sp. SIO2A8]
MSRLGEQNFPSMAAGQGERLSDHPLIQEIKEARPVMFDFGSSYLEISLFLYKI